MTLEGFVTREPGMPADELLLTRFVISCCVADATTATVRIVGAPPGGLRRRRVDHRHRAGVPAGGRVVVAASSMAAIATPADPYLSSV